MSQWLRKRLPVFQNVSTRRCLNIGVKVSLVQHFVQVNTKDIIRISSGAGESIGDRRFPVQRASKSENTSMA